MPSEEHSGFVGAWVRALNENDWAGVSDTIGGSRRDLQGPDAGCRADIKQWYDSLFASSPDPAGTLTDAGTEWDKVQEQWTACAARRGDFPGASALAKAAGSSGVMVIRFADGRAVNGWFVEGAEESALVQQAGVQPQARAVGASPRTGR
jgi:hypothetical protein